MPSSHPWCRRTARDARGRSMRTRISSRPWSNDPVERTAGGDHLPARRTDRRSVERDAAADPRSGRPYLVRHGFGYSCFEHDAHGIAYELLQFVPLEEPVKISRLQDRQSLGAGRGRCRSRIISNGCSAASAPHRRPSSSPASMPGPALLARNPWNADVRGPRRLHGHGRPRSKAATGDRTGVSRPSRVAGGARGAAAGRALVEPGGRRARIPAARCRRRLTSPPGESASSSCCWAKARSRTRRAALIRRYRALIRTRCCRRSPAFWERNLGRRAGPNAGPGDGPDAERLAALPGAGCRLWARIGVLSVRRRLRLSRPAAGRRWRLLARGPQLAREHMLRAAARQFTEGDVQHWWHPAIGPGRAHPHAPTIALAAFVRAHYVEVTGDAGVLDEHVPFLEGRGSAPGPAGAYFGLPGRCDEIGAALRALRPRARLRASHVGCARPAADRHRRLERRHEPGRRRRTRRERLARLVPLHATLLSVRSRSRRRAASELRGGADGASTPASARRDRARTLGTATGIAAAISTTERRWDPRTARNAASIPSPNPGRCSPAPGDPKRAARAMAAVDAPAGRPRRAA